MKTLRVLVLSALLLLIHLPLCKAQSSDFLQLDTVHFDPIPLLTASSQQSNRPKIVLGAGAGTWKYNRKALSLWKLL